MRILQVSESLASGTLGVVRSVADALAEQGHEVVVAHGARPETPADLRAQFDPRVELVALPWTRRTAAAQAATGRALRRLASERRPDVAHLHSSFAGAVGAAVLPRSIPTIFTPHASPLARAGRRGPRRAAYRTLARAIARRCDLIGAVSEAEAELMRTVADVERVVVVPNGIPELDHGAIPAPRARALPVAVAMGRIGPQRLPAETAAILRGAADLAEVAWVGGAPAGEDAPLLRARVPVTGWLTREEALDRLAGATAYVHWSAWDGQALTILEAFARDVVVIASDIPANRELVGERQVCRTPEQAASLLRGVLRDPALRESLLAGQRERRERWGASRMAVEWVRLYAALAGGHAPARAPSPRAITATARNIGVPWS